MQSRDDVRAKALAKLAGIERTAEALAAKAGDEPATTSIDIQPADEAASGEETTIEPIDEPQDTA